MDRHNPSHPGRILRLQMGEEITVSALAKHLKMTRANLSMILNGRLGISALMAIKLSEAFPKTTPQFWLNIQNDYDLAHALRKKRRKITPLIPQSNFQKAA
jgi:addiction module HigA family antidote